MKLTSKQKQLVKEYAKNLQSRLNEDSKSAIGSLVIIDRNDRVLIEQKIRYRTGFNSYRFKNRITRFNKLIR